jgi:MerR family transcriptional regulator, light-induced transcriptional regulator
VPANHNEPAFNLRAVVQQTGVKPDTLRAWERRYGLPAPDRSSGGHRLYSQRDIDTIKWLLARQREGLSISRAVEMWEQLGAGGQDPLLATAPAGQSPAPLPAGGTVAELREQWMDACLAYDRQRTEHILNHAFALYAPETVVVELLQQALAQIGEGWYHGAVTVQQEHFCAALVTRRLDALLMAAPPPTRPGRILAACPPEENHTISLLLLTYLLRRRGWEVVYLGANAPVEQLETTIAATRPHLVIMTAQLLYTAATLRNASLFLQEQGAPLAYGGRIFNVVPALRQRIAGHFLGESIQTAPGVIESLMSAPRPPAGVEEIAETYQQALEHFQERQGAIEAYVLRASIATLPAQAHLPQANREIGQNISAALALGDMAFLEGHLDWLLGLWRYHQMPMDALRDYLTAYRQGAGEQMDARGRPIVEWLDALLSRLRANGLVGS